MAENDENITAQELRGDEKKPRRWWVRLLRGTGWTLLCVVYALIIICSAIVWVLSPDQLTPMIERVASKSLNADVKVDRAELTFWRSFPEIKVQIDELQVISRALDPLPVDARKQLPADADSVLSIGHFNGGVNILHIIGGKITVYDVELDRPRINLIQVNDTIANFDILPPSPSDTTSTPLPEITVNHFAITNSYPIRYRSLPDSVDVTLNLHTISLDSDEAPRYQLTLDTRIQTPLLKDVSYETAKFSLDGSVNWSAKEPARFNIYDLDFKLEDDIDMTVSTSVDVTDNIRFNRLEMELRNLRPTNIVKHLPQVIREDFASLRTDMSINLSAKLLRPYILTDSISVPWVEAHLSIPACSFNFYTIDFRKFAAEMKATINGDDIDKSKVVLDNLEIDGNALDVKVTGTLSTIFSDPGLDGTFYGALDFDRFPPVLKQKIEGRLTGTLDADTRFNLHLSDLSEDNFHKANISGEINVRNLRFLSPDTSTNIYSRHTHLEFGTDRSFSREGAKVDSLLVVKARVDTAYLYSRGTEMRLRSLRAGFGTSNVASSSDTTRVNPFGGAVHFDEFYCYSPGDSIRMRMHDVGGFAMLQRYKGEAKVPELGLRFSAGRMLVAQPVYRASLAGAKIDITAHLRQRRAKGSRPKRPDTDIPAEVLRAMAEADSARHSLPRHLLRLTAEQLDSIGVETIDFEIDNSIRSLLRRWNLHGTVMADRGNLRLPHLRLRNSFKNLDLTFNTDSIELRSLNYQFGHSDFMVKGMVSNIRQALSTRRPGPVKIDFDIISDSINVNEIVNSLATAGAEAQSGIDNTLDDWAKDELANFENPETLPDSITGPILIPVNIDASLDIHAGKVIYSDLVFDDFAGELLIYHGMVNLHNLSGNTEVGKISVSGLYSAPTADKINLGMAMDLRNFHIARLPQVIPALDSIVPMIRHLSGVVNAQVAVTSDITPDMYFNIPSLKAAMQFSGDSLVVFDNGTFRSLSKWLMFKNKNRNMIDHLNIEITVENGVLNIYPFLVDIDRYKLGVMGYNDLDFNLNYHISVLKSPIPFKFGINIKGTPEHMKIRLGGAKFKDKMVAQRDSIAINTRISLLSEINGAFRRGLRAARLGPLRIKGAPDNSYMQEPEDKFSLTDSAAMIREGMLEVPDSVAADILLRTNPVAEDDKKSK